MKKVGSAASNCIKIIAFVALFLVMFTSLYGIFRLNHTKPIDNFYELEPDSVSVLCLGSSHMYCSIDPAILYKEYGIVSYDLGSAKQPIWNSYFYLKEALKTQSPEVVILDVAMITYNIEDVDYEATVKTTLGMKNSLNFVRAVRESVSEESQNGKMADYYLRFPWVHTRYAELGAEDFSRDAKEEKYRNFLGFEVYEKRIVADVPDVLLSEAEPVMPSERNLGYLDDIRRLCEENGISLILVNAPYYDNAQLLQPYYNYISEYAAERGIPYFEGNMIAPDLEWDSERDYADSNHISINGAAKWTRYLGTYLVENYDLTVNYEDGFGRYVRWEREIEYRTLVYGENYGW